jgi:DNA-binding LacI/PurR family transcriptional regulator
MVGIEEEARHYNKLITLSVFHSDAPDQKEAIQTLINPPLVDGLIFLLPTIAMDSLFKALVQKNFPLIVASERRYEELAASVVIDNLNGAKLGAQYLIGKGHKRIGFITGRSENTDSQDRLEGYKLALLEAGIPIDEKLIIQGNYELLAGMEAAEKFLEMPDPPTAVFASNDRMAIGVLKTLHVLSKEGAFAVMGFDDILMASLVHPGLTTVGYDLKELGKQAVHKLMRLVSGEEKNRSILQMKTHLVVRESA